MVNKMSFAEHVLPDDVAMRLTVCLLIRCNAYAPHPFVEVLQIEVAQLAVGLEERYLLLHHQLVQIRFLDAHVGCGLFCRE